MDPNATLAMIDQFLAAGRTGVAVDVWCHELWTWIQRGGFEPDWKRYELGTSYYRCRAVHEPLPAAELAELDEYTGPHMGYAAAVEEGIA